MNAWLLVPRTCFPDLVTLGEVIIVNSIGLKKKGPFP